MGNKCWTYTFVCKYRVSPALYPDISLLLKVFMQLKLGRRKRLTRHFSFLISPSHGLLHFIIISHLHFALALMQKTKRLKRRQGCYLYMRSVLYRYNSLHVTPSSSGAPNVNFWKHLFGRRFEI